MRARPALRQLFALCVLLGVLASSSSVFAGGANESSKASAAGATETVVFSSLRHGNSELYAVHPDGTSLERLTNHPALDAFPSLSPDGDRIAFASTRAGNSEIYAMNVDGTGVVRLTNHQAIDSEPEWSPDGARIAFTSGRTGKGDIYSMNAADGANLVRLTSHATPDVSPAWSPDGASIAFSSMRSGLGDIYRVRADGSQPQRLTSSIAPDLFPAWAPGGNQIAFSSLRSGLGDIYRMRADGSEQTRMTSGAAVEAEPAWSPDGTRLAISFKAEGTLNVDLRVVRVDGSGSVPLAPHPTLDSSPDWSTSGTEPPPPGDGVLLPGAADELALGAISDFDTGKGVPESEISLDSNGVRVARTQFEIALHERVTVGAVNALLDSVDARIISMLEGVPYLVVQIPDPGSVAALDALLADVRAHPAVVFVNEGRFAEPDALPANISTSAEDIQLVDNHLAVKAHAAWNARAALGVLGKPKVVVADVFGDGTPSADVDVNLVDGAFGSGAPDDHGYHVLGIIAGTFGGDATPRGQVTGMLPETADTAVVDLVVGAAQSLRTMAVVENLVLGYVGNATGDVVVNTSLNYCAAVNGATCGNTTAAGQAAVTWIDKVRAAGLENRFLHVTSAGNIKTATPGVTDAQTNSGFAAAKLLPGLLKPDQSGNLVPVPSLTNTFVVENVRNFAGTATPACLNVGSKVGGDISGMGTNVHSFLGATAGAGDQSGTSMATPQVAALAAFLWSLDPAMTVTEVMSAMLGTASPGVFVSSPACSTLTSKPLIDAYAAVLSLDAAALPTRAGSPIRNAILDQDGDGQFTVADVQEFRDRYLDSSGAPVVPASADYGRYDLNGDGFTGGSRRSAFDLDRVASTQYGPALYSPDVEQQIESLTVRFNESAVTDLDVLCYYAYSDLLASGGAGDLAALSGLLAVHCVPEVKIAFTSNRDDGGQLEIYVMNADGSAQTQLTNSTEVGVENFHSSWSPDRTRIAFASNRVINNGFYNNHDIYVMNADGSRPTRLTTALGEDAFPAWSPDGTKIAFTSYRDGDSTAPGRTVEIYVMNADGTGQTRLTNNDRVVYDSHPSWSPDGTKILFESNRVDRRSQLFVMNADGSGQTQLTNGTQGGREPKWSPDGTKIAFTRGDGLAVMDADGSDVALLVSNPSFSVTHDQASWSPDGTRIAFRKSFDIYVMYADGSEQTRLTVTRRDSWPSWSS